MPELTGIRTGNTDMAKRPRRAAAVIAHEGAEAIYREGPILAHVRVRNVQTDKAGLRADLAVIQTLPAGFENTHVPAQWSISASWDDDVEALYWGIPVLGVKLYFGQALVNAVVAFCNELPGSDPAGERCLKTVNFLLDLFNRNAPSQTEPRPAKVPKGKPKVPPSTPDGQLVMADLPPVELASILSTVVDDPESARLLGLMYQGQGNLRSAVSCFEHSINLDPQPDTSVNLALVLRQMGDEARAVEALAGFYQLVATEEWIQYCEHRLREHGYAALIEPAKALGMRTRQAPFPLIGSHTAAWTKRFVGKTINVFKLRDWSDCSRERFVDIYPPTPGFIARSLEACEPYGCLNCSIFLFVSEKSQVICSVRFSVVHMTPEREMVDLFREPSAEDRKQIEAALDILIGNSAAP